jgi:hypothetical protein
MHNRHTPCLGIPGLVGRNFTSVASDAIIRSPLPRFWNVVRHPMVKVVMRISSLSALHLGEGTEESHENIVRVIRYPIAIRT